MKNTNFKTVIDRKQLKRGKTATLGELPSGILFAYDGALYQTIVHPQMNVVQGNPLIDVYAHNQGEIFHMRAKLPIIVCQVI